MTLLLLSKLDKIKISSWIRYKVKTVRLSRLLRNKNWGFFSCCGWALWPLFFGFLGLLSSLWYDLCYSHYFRHLSTIYLCMYQPNKYKSLLIPTLPYLSLHLITFDLMKLPHFFMLSLHFFWLANIYFYFS